MRLTVKHAKNGDVSVVFKADGRRKKEGMDLKEALLAAVRKDHGFTPATIIRELESRGYSGEIPEDQLEKLATFQRARKKAGL